MWGGRFASGPDELFRAINDSLPFDWTLVEQDITGSIAWARGLVGAGVLSAAESERLIAALSTVREEARALPGPPTDSGAEDVHTWVEQRLIALVGDLGKKLHTGRSRNDQVATDLRLWTRDAIDARLADIREAQAALVALGERAGSVFLPGYTHLQRAQPIVLGHWCLAYVEMLERDRQRLADARTRANLCPLGSAALAGTAYPIDRGAIASELGFDAPTANSLDSVSDRDFVIETLAAASLCAAHLSRLAEELIIYTTGEFGFVTFGDEVTSGSSIMPQKKNPDALELIRGKTGRIIGHHTAMLIAIKGLPLAYNKDLQEDKEPIFDAMRQLSLCLRLAAKTVESSDWHADRCRAAAAGSFSNATELADYLVGRGVAFRDAHHQVGQLVRVAIERECALEDLSLDQIRGVAPAAEDGVFERLTLESAVARRDVPGGTSPKRVNAQLASWRAKLGSCH